MDPRIRVGRGAVPFPMTVGGGNRVQWEISSSERFFVFGPSVEITPMTTR
jgi:hypothetical protein